MSAILIHEIFDWFRTHEFIAIWLEGFALLAIFIWDRIDGHQQHKSNIAQLAASQELAEAGQKPCLVFSTAPRAAVDAILGEFEGADGAMTLLFLDGKVQLENIGSGPAINAKYRLAPTDPASTISRPSGYLVWMSSGAKFSPPVSRGLLQGNEWEMVVVYESLSGRKYQTKTTVSNLVLTDFKFELAPE